MPPPLHPGAPPSVHLVSGSLLPSSACCWADAAALLALCVERKEGTPPKCDLPAFCNLPAIPQPATPSRLHVITSCQLLSSLSLSSRSPLAVLSPAPLPDHPEHHHHYILTVSNEAMVGKCLETSPVTEILHCTRRQHDPFNPPLRGLSGPCQRLGFVLGPRG